MGRSRTIGVGLGGALAGAALAVVATQAWSVGAAPGDLDATYQPLEPCRLIDTRPAPDNVGDRLAPLGAGETFTAQVTGTNGNCVDVPVGATGVAANVTVVNPAAASFLSLFPADLTDTPLVSNLNYVAGAPPTPNKVDVKLSPDGKIKIFNAAGTADVIVDIVGVYVNSSLTEIESRLAALEDRDVELANDIRDAIPTTLRREGTDTTITSSWTQVVSYTGINLTRNGTVLVFASATAVEFEGGADVKCVITDRTSGFADNDNMRWEAAGTNNSEAGEGDAGNIAGVESFAVSAGGTGNFYLYCRNLDAEVPDGNSEIWDPQLTLLFVPLR